MSKPNPTPQTLCAPLPSFCHSTTQARLGTFASHLTPTNARRFFPWLLCLLLGVVWVASTAEPVEAAPEIAQKKKRSKKKRSKKKRSKKKRTSRSKRTEVPLNIGFGPSFYWLTGPLQADQAPHYGLKLSLAAIIDKKIIKRKRKSIPKKYRGLLKNVDELRISHLLIPDAIIISPQTNNTGIYGVTWRPLAIQPPIIKSPRLSVGAGLLLTYAYITTEAPNDKEQLPAGDTHFLRPGIDLRAELEIPLSELFLLSFGWSSAFYIPQKLGGSIVEVEPFDQSTWHWGQAYFLLNFRVPYKTRI